MTASTSTGNRRPGRPRDARADQAILEAAAELLAERGLGEFSVEAVAERAGVGKATVYRRWPSKADLVGATAATIAGALPEIDTGSLRDDLRAHAAALAATLLRKDVGLLASVCAEATVNAETRAILDAFVKERRRPLVAMVRRAISRGELPQDTDVDAVIDLAIGALFYRHLVTGAPVNRRVAERFVDAACSGLLAAPPLRRSRR